MKISGVPSRPRRRMNLTPMIDVIFLLLVFFMMVSRFGGLHGLPLTMTRQDGARQDGARLDGAGQDGSGWSGPPRLVDIRPDGVALNGVALAPEALPAALLPLMQGPGDTIVLRARDGATVQDIVAALGILRMAGLTHLAMVE